MKGYVLDYINENEFKKLERALKKYKIVPEMCDNDFAVFMASTENTSVDFKRLEEAFANIPLKKPIKDDVQETNLQHHERKLSIREAVFAPHKTLPVDEAIGEVCGAPTVSCPPAVPVVISGEVITEQDAELMKKYNIKSVDVVDL